MVWRFGYGSNVGLKNLEKKSLNPKRCVAGKIVGWELFFKKAFSPYVEPAWAAIREKNGEEVHGTAFLISEDEADGLDRQERGYDVLPFSFTAYDGEVIEGVGLYVSKNGHSGNQGLPSLRYLRLMQNGAREAGLSAEWIHRLDSVRFYVTPPEVRSQTETWIAEFRTGQSEVWTAEKLSEHDGSTNPIHVSAMGYIVKLEQPIRFASWRGHDITRRNLLQFNGKNLDTNDIRFDQPDFRPMPNLSSLRDEEREYLLQNLDSLLHNGGTVVARLKDFVEDQS